MFTAVGVVGLIGIDSEGGAAAYFSLSLEAGPLNETQLDNRSVWFYFDLGEGGRTPGRALLQEIYRAQRTGERVSVTFDATHPHAGGLLSDCLRAASVQLLSVAEMAG